MKKPFENCNTVTGVTASCREDKFACNVVTMVISH